VLVLDRFFNPFSIDLHGNGANTYKVVPETMVATAPSIDTVIAERLSAGLPFDMVSMSYKGEPPARAFDRYLGAIGAAGAGQLQQRRSVVAVARTQIERTRPRVGREDGQRLDRYLAALRDNERSLERLTSLDCPRLPARSDLAVLSKYEPVKPLLSHAHVDIAATALACGLTRVANLNFVPGRGPFQFFDPNPNAYNLQGALGEQAISSDTRYADLVAGLHIESVAGGDSSNSWIRDRHDAHHAGTTGLLTAMDRWEAALVARLIERLEAVPEADGTMWDHTLVLWANSGGGMHHGGASDHPAILIAGPKVGAPRAGAGLRTGRYVSFPKKTRAMSDLFVTTANAVGVQMAKFGDAGICQGALPGMR